MSDNWVEVAKSDAIEMEDLIRFDHGDKTYCVYKIEDGYFATDGMLEGGPVLEYFRNFAPNPKNKNELKGYRRI